MDLKQLVISPINLSHILISGQAARQGLAKCKNQREAFPSCSVPSALCYKEVLESASFCSCCHEWSQISKYRTTSSHSSVKKICTRRYPLHWKLSPSFIPRLNILLKEDWNRTCLSSATYLCILLYFSFLTWEFPVLFSWRALNTVFKTNNHLILHSCQTVTSFRQLPISQVFGLASGTWSSDSDQLFPSPSHWFHGASRLIVSLQANLFLWVLFKI